MNLQLIPSSVKFERLPTSADDTNTEKTVWLKKVVSLNKKRQDDSSRQALKVSGLRRCSKSIFLFIALRYMHMYVGVLMSSGPFWMQGVDMGMRNKPL